VGYFTIPSIDKIKVMSPSQMAAIPDFTIGHNEYGSIKWSGVTDVRGLDLDEIVRFEPSSVEIYPDGTEKAKEGVGLNKTAIVTLKNCWPMDKITNKRHPISDPAKLQQHRKKLQKSAQLIGATMVDFDMNNGDWIFKVRSF